MAAGCVYTEETHLVKRTTTLLLACCLSVLSAHAQTTPVPLQKPDPPIPAPATGPLKLAFTFDDLPAHAPKPRTTSRVAIVQSVLGTLKRENLPPVYGFVNGYKVTLQPNWMRILRMWHGAGEPLGNHTFSHPELDKSTLEEYETEIEENEPILKKIYRDGKKVDPDGDWHWFRFPYLEEGDTVEKREAIRGYLKEHGYRIAEVSMDFQDYLWNDPYQRCMDKRRTADVQWLHDSYLQQADQAIAVYRTLAQRVYGHDIPYVLLMHIGAFDAKMLPELIALFRERGFGFTTLEQAEADPAYSVDAPMPMPGGGLLEEYLATQNHVGFPDNDKPEKKLDRLCR